MEWRAVWRAVNPRIEEDFKDQDDMHPPSCSKPASVYMSITFIVLKLKLKPRYLVQRRLTEQIQCQRRFTIVEVVTDWHWLQYIVPHAAQVSSAHSPRNGLWTRSCAAIWRTMPQPATLGLNRFPVNFLRFRCIEQILTSRSMHNSISDTSLSGQSVALVLTTKQQSNKYNHATYLAEVTTTAAATSCVVAGCSHRTWCYY